MSLGDWDGVEGLCGWAEKPPHHASSKEVWLLLRVHGLREEGRNELKKGLETRADVDLSTAVGIVKVCTLMLRINCHAWTCVCTGQIFSSPA